MKISIIIPTLNEAEKIGGLCKYLFEHGKEYVQEIIVVDAESRDGTPDRAGNAGANRLALGKRPVMRKLLYALAARPGDVLSKDELTQAAWARPYDPIRHDNPLFVNLSRLRSLLKPVGLTVEADSDQGGYRLLSKDPVLVRRSR